ncbi:amidase family protein [Nocardia aurantiaca]|uniref:amidase family protein n=1 Tax=Nocardia aurantiaca TaxID=2675850 RepID=UPI0018AAA31E|nr:amidase [Nocardia aurantiaca]
MIRVGIKDTVDIAGWPTRFGLPHFRRYPETTAPIVRHLPEDTLVAKLTTTQLSVGRASGCVNPYFPGLDPAGSSTGSAVAVAANICDVALGTDVLGSVRFPAGCCGVTGLRMTHQPRLTEGLLTISSLLDAPGWITRTPADLAYLWEALDLQGLLPSGNEQPPREGVIGVVAEVAGEDCDDDVFAALTAAQAEVAAAGLGLKPVELSTVWHVRADAWRLCAFDTYRLGRRWRDLVDSEFDDATRAAFDLLDDVTDEEYDSTVTALQRVRSVIADLFAAQGVDAWLLPLGQRLPVALGAIPAGTPTILNPRDSRFGDRLGFTSLASAAGLPAICFPIGVHPHRHTPVPVQLVGPPGSEAHLIELAVRIGGPGALDLLPR